jgi:hypothetical protein
VVRADLVAAIGRKGDAMGQEQDFAHDQASPRAMNGPTRLATGSGSFCHRRMRAW